jgi:hypothetical protein
VFVLLLSQVHESAALDVQGSIHNLRSVLAQPLYAY